MEEAGNMVWIGRMVAKHGSPAFQRVWKDLQPVLQHHLFAVEPSAADFRSANKAMDRLCCTFEDLVHNGTVRPRRAPLTMRHSGDHAP